jgi:hypothetical protein
MTKRRHTNHKPESHLCLAPVLLLLLLLLQRNLSLLRYLPLRRCLPLPLLLPLLKNLRPVAHEILVTALVFLPVLS